MTDTNALRREAKRMKLPDDMFTVASEASPFIPRTSTGILSLDQALGGGWATNQWNELVGNESAGKTALAYKTVANDHQQDPDSYWLWVAAEEFVPSYAKAIGVDLDRLMVMETNQMETVLEFVLKVINDRMVDGVVIDSLPALVTQVETEKGMDEPSVATGAQLLSRFFRKCADAQRRSLREGSDDRDCTMIAINQWRDAIGVMYGDPRTTPGGKAKNYYFFTRIDVSRKGWLADGSNVEDRVGQTIRCRTMKNKTYRPSQVAEFDFYFADSRDGFKMGEFDHIRDLATVAIDLELVDRSGAWYYLDRGTPDEQKWNGLAAFSDALKDDAVLRDQFQAAAYQLLQRDKIDYFKGEEEGS